MITTATPFVLLDNQRPDGRGARLFRRPAEIVQADHPADVRTVLDRIGAAAGRGLHAAGMLAYEAGHALEPRLAGRAGAVSPLAWFGLFETVEVIAPGDLLTLLPDPAGAWAAAPRPLTREVDYRLAIERVAQAIAAGDIYQANITFPAEVPIAGNPLSLYARLRHRAAAPWGAIVWTGERWLLSFSPELFFTLDDRQLTARPMKGTASRDGDPAALGSDPKQRAENLMIVDLLRNDLGRVAATGSVQVVDLFTVETYPTIYQLTSTVTATLAPELGAADVLAAAFPCGSVTGAPKLRAMEIIADVEARTRGAYTGAIGAIEKNGDAAFNVAIRTLALEAGADNAILGLGSGIVADSEAGDEWRECLAKGAFVSEPPHFDLIETMRFDPAAGVAEIDWHLARLKASAEQLGFRFDRHGLRNELQAATFWLQETRRIRVRLSPSGAVAIDARRLPSTPAAPVQVALAPLPVPATDFRLRHKTSDRGFYDEARAAAGTFEVLFVDPLGFMTEGSFTNIFVERDGTLLTPPLGRGLLPGVLRARLLDEGAAVEADLEPADLAGGFLIGNALRGLIRAELVAARGRGGL